LITVEKSRGKFSQLSTRKLPCASSYWTYQKCSGLGLRIGLAIAAVDMFESNEVL